MTQKRTQTPKVDLPGHFYQRSERWWWRVRLPGESRSQARPLCKKGETSATRNRRTAQQVALNLWEEALIRDTENRVKAKARSQGQEKSRAYAYLIDLLCEGLLRNPRLESSLELFPAGESCLDEPEDDLIYSTSLDSIDVVESPLGIGHVSDISDLLSMLAEGQRQCQDRTGCDCCGAKDFFEEYLQRIDSGQRLCPRCFRAFQEKAREIKRLVCNTR